MRRLLLLVLVLTMVNPGASAASADEVAIADGFHTVEGTTLLGGAVPTGVAYVFDGVPQVDEGWTAMLDLSGDPAKVIRAFERQAIAQGLRPRSTAGSGAHRCAVTWYGVHECAVLARNTDEAHPRSLEVHTIRDGRSSAVQLRYSTDHLYWQYPLRGVYGGDPDGAVPPIPPTPAQPGVGEPFGEEWPQLGRMHVERGSAVIGRPMSNVSCATIGSFVTIAVTERASVVLSRYARQLATIVPTDVGRRTQLDVDRGRLHRVSASEAGGDGFLVTIFDPSDPDLPSIGHISTCVD
jgi:hypothetical protein